MLCPGATVATWSDVVFFVRVSTSNKSERPDASRHAAMSCTDTAPCRNNKIRPGPFESSEAAASTLATVLSTPTLHTASSASDDEPGLSESTIQTSSCSRSSQTWLAVVGDTCPNLFALGAASGTLAASINRRAILPDGDRHATKPVFAISIGGTLSFAFATIVNGPGQNRSQSAFNTLPSQESGSASQSSNALERSFTCTISGSVSGRSFASKTLVMAFESNALQPSPYTVSVGNATRSPPRRREPHSSKSLFDGTILANTALSTEVEDVTAAAVDACMFAVCVIAVGQK
mmetsp:Transcript_4815/g.13877  ORF Transcript_4815/g.13877 Transcript_4815/m.13877 type:complete len:291 (-) Transcript_4815:406-1278(-)